MLHTLNTPSSNMGLNDPLTELRLRCLFLIGTDDDDGSVILNYFQMRDGVNTAQDLFRGETCAVITKSFCCGQRGLVNQQVGNIVNEGEGSSRVEI